MIAVPIQIDAKLNAFRRSPRGFFITLEVAPDSDWEELARAPLGQAFGVAMVAYDSETGKASPGSGASSVTNTGQQRDEPGKSRKPWSAMPRAQQAGILCADPRFAKWLEPTGFGNGPEDAADYIRRECGVKSRADLDQPEAREKFDAIVTTFRRDTGQMAEQR